MRPPEFTGGNDAVKVLPSGNNLASMRPPEFTGGNARAIAENWDQLQALQ